MVHILTDILVVLVERNAEGAVRGLGESQDPATCSSVAASILRDQGPSDDTRRRMLERIATRGR